MERRVLYEIRDFVELGNGDFGDLLRKIHRTQVENNPTLQMLDMFGGGEEFQYGVRPTPVGLFKTSDLKSFTGHSGLEWYSSGSSSGERSVVPLRDGEAYQEAIHLSLYGTQVEKLFSQKDLYVLNLVPTPREWPNSSLAYMFDHIFTNQTQGMQGVVARGDRPGDLHLNEYIYNVLEQKVRWDVPVGIVTTSYMGVAFMDSLGSALKLPKGSFMIDTGGYKGIVREHSREEYIQKAQKTLGLESSHILSEYGMSELSSPFWSEYVEGREVYRIPLTVRVEILNPDEDGVGQVILYDLLNLWSTCALLTEDLGKVVEIDGTEYFTPLGRMKGAEPKGCSITAERAHNG